MAKSIRRYELSDSEWERLKPYFEKEESQKRGRPRRNARELLNAILSVERHGVICRNDMEHGKPHTNGSCSGLRAGFWRRYSMN